MFDIYKSIEGSVMQGVDRQVKSIFAAWCHLNRVTKLNNNLKEEFLEDVLEGEGDILDKILAQEDEVKSYLHFWNLDFENFELKEVALLYSQAKIRELEKQWTVEKLSRYLGLDLEDQKVEIHFVEESEAPVRFYYFRLSGALFVVSGSFIEDNIDDIFDIEYVNFFKALSDHTRLQIVFALASGTKTSSELAELCAVTLSTINHHMKILAEEKIVQLHLSSKEGRGATFILNQEILKLNLNFFIQLLQA